MREDTDDTGKHTVYSLIEALEFIFLHCRSKERTRRVLETGV